jgi:hypothetical protein
MSFEPDFLQIKSLIFYAEIEINIGQDVSISCVAVESLQIRSIYGIVKHHTGRVFKFLQLFF